MKENDDRNERPAFDKHSSSDQFLNGNVDDEIREAHRSELRREVLEAFDHAQVTAASLPIPISPAGHQPASWSRLAGAAAILAACLLGIALLWSGDAKDPIDEAIAVHPSNLDADIDSQLLASLTEVDAFREQVSAEALFAAIAMCQAEHDRRYFSHSIEP